MYSCKISSSFIHPSFTEIKNINICILFKLKGNTVFSNQLHHTALFHSFFLSFFLIFLVSPVTKRTKFQQHAWFDITSCTIIALILSIFSFDTFKGISALLSEIIFTMTNIPQSSLHKSKSIFFRKYKENFSVIFCLRLILNYVDYNQLSL